MRRLTVLLAAILLAGGCSTYREVPRSTLTPDLALGTVRVATLDGYEYKFLRAQVVPDTLFGFYEVTEERVGPKKEVWYEEALRRQGIPLSGVARVELIRKDPVRTVLYGASIGAAGYFLVNLVDESARKPKRPGGSGKPPIEP